MKDFEPPIRWTDYEDIAMKLYERFGDEFTEAKIYRVGFTELLEWVLQIPNFAGTREEATEGHLEMIQSSWVHEWRDNQKPSDSNIK
jgi:FeS assembly protein IscX